MTNSNKERWIYQQVAEMSKTLGIPVPEVQMINRIAGSRELWRGTLGLADSKEHKITIRTRGQQLRSLRHTIAHEFIHLAFPNIPHNTPRHEQYISALMSGHMAFDRRGLITEVVKPAPPVDARITELLARKKKLETKLKRISTSIKKIDRKIKHLEKKKKALHKQEEE